MDRAGADSMRRTAGSGPGPPPATAAERSAAGLVLGAIGVVFGDIGTNVLFAMRAAFLGPHSVSPGPSEVLGVLSLVFWALILVLGVKYLGFVMRADNHGEGGILALLALMTHDAKAPPRLRAALVAIALFGAALVYGDGVITPAISVLAAVEGLAVVDPRLERIVVPATVGILFALFAFQRRGTGRIGAVFGPVMVVWFIAIAALGVMAIVANPAVVAAADPRHAARFLADYGGTGFLVLGAIVLTVAGAEALYADMGHFGVRPIRIAWFTLVFPALLLNYFGQGAALLDRPAVATSPFYALVPGPLHYPMVALATAATIIASQALISGAFSLTRQAVQLGYLPPVEIRHTSAVVPGRVYVPEVNIVLAVLCITLVLAFRASSRLAAAYGMAVAGAMIGTSILYYFVTRTRWHWGRVHAAAVVGAFLTVDLAFLGANLVKIPHGAWIPLVIAGAVYAVMSTWCEGRTRLRRSIEPVSDEAFLRELAAHPPRRGPGAGVFLSPSPAGVPSAVVHYVRATGTLPERVLLLTIISREVPVVADRDRLEVRRLREDVVHVNARYGFMETPRVPELFGNPRIRELGFRLEHATFFTGLVTLIPAGRFPMARWRRSLFAFLWRNAQPSRMQLRIPPSRVVEIGIAVEI